MPQVFIACDRDQEMLLPPSLLDWVPEDHLVWTILGAVEELDLSAFYGVYRADGDGRPAYEPSMMAWLRCCCTRMRGGGIVRRVGSSVSVVRTWRTS
jgi:transposase